MHRLIEKYKDVVPYLFFGVCTTLVNIIVYWLCAHTFGMRVMSGTIIAWVIAVFFAYLTNRKWVFDSEAEGAKDILRETMIFFLCRLATGVCDGLLMYMLVYSLHFNDVLIKTIANAIVIILNYIASRVLVFRRSNDVRK